MRRLQWQGWVKVQRSVHTTARQPQVLIYNESRTIEVQTELSDEVAKMMGERLRVYLRAALRDDGNLALDHSTVRDDCPW